MGFRGSEPLYFGCNIWQRVLLDLINSVIVTVYKKIFVVNLKETCFFENPYTARFVAQARNHKCCWCLSFCLWSYVHT